MSGLGLIDRIATVAITASITSAVWFASDHDVFRIKRVDSEQASVVQGSPQAPAERTAPPGREWVDVRSPTMPQTSAQGSLIIPVEGVALTELTDSYADSRSDGARLHEAIDIMAPAGTPVIAAAGGTVEKLFQSEAGGLTVYVRSTDRETLYYYAHLDRYATGLREGQVVAAGREIGTVGSSGNASDDAPHLHFAIMRTASNAQWWEPAIPVNPYPILTGKPIMGGATVSRP